MVSMRIFGTPVKTKVIVLVDFVAIWGGVTWLGLYWHPERGLWQGLLIGFVTAILLWFAEIGHAIAHIFSARFAGARMDEILISEGMPRTLYADNEVSPDTHRIRAIGGPFFNLLGLLLSVTIYVIASGSSIARELAAWSAVGHGLLFIMSLSPLPFADGGTLLKWTLVARGTPIKVADKIVRQIDLVIGILGGIICLWLIVMKMWIAGLILMAISVIVMLIAAGKLR